MSFQHAKTKERSKAKMAALCASLMGAALTLCLWRRSVFVTDVVVRSTPTRAGAAWSFVAVHSNGGGVSIRWGIDDGQSRVAAGQAGGVGWRIESPADYPRPHPYSTRSWQLIGIGYERRGQDAPAVPGYSDAAEWRGVILPDWLVLLPFLVLPAVHGRAAVLRWRARRRVRRGACPVCSYDVRFSTGKCPECGAVIEPSAEAPSRIGWRAMLAALAVVLPATGLALGLYASGFLSRPAPPVAPKVVARAATPYQVELIWPKPATKVFVYDIERRARGETQWTKCLGAGGDETTYSDLTAAADTAYEYRVTARDMFGQSAQSTATVVTPPAQNFEERLLDGSSS